MIGALVTAPMSRFAAPREEVFERSRKCSASSADRRRRDHEEASFQEDLDADSLDLVEMI